MDLDLDFDQPEDQAEVEKFLALIEERQQRASRGVAAQTIFKVGWLLFVLAVVYFAFVGFPLWNGIVYSLW